MGNSFSFTPITPVPPILPAGQLASSGPLAVSIDALRSLLASTPYFQTWTNSHSADAALASIFVGEAGYPIAAVSIASDVLTITTREPHKLTVGQLVNLQGASIGAQSSLPIDGTYAIVSVPAANTFTVAIAAADVAMVYPAGAFVVPSGEPFAVIVEDGGGGLNSRVIGTGGAGIYSGALEILFENATASQYANDPQNALTQARNEISLLVEGLTEAQGTGDLMCCNAIDVSVAPQFVPMQEQSSNAGRFERWQALVKVTWGLDG